MRVKPLNDGKDDPRKMCKKVVKQYGKKTPGCMKMISIDQVTEALNNYMRPYNYYREWSKRFINGEIML